MNNKIIHHATLFHFFPHFSNSCSVLTSLWAVASACCTVTAITTLHIVLFTTHFLRKHLGYRLITVQLRDASLMWSLRLKISCRNEWHRHAALKSVCCTFINTQRSKASERVSFTVSTSCTRVGTSCNMSAQKQAFCRHFVKQQVLSILCV